MSYYNQTTTKERNTLPSNITSPAGIVTHPTTAQLEAAGWITSPVVAFVPATGYEIIPGTRTIEVIGGLAYEQYEVETHAQADARRAAEKAAQEQAEADAAYADLQTRCVLKCINRRLTDPPTATGAIDRDEYELTYKSLLD